jgi:hypothetical protein
MITVYQIRLTDADIKKANAEGFDASPVVSAKTSMMLGARKWSEDYVKFYTPVYQVDTENLNQAFESTNLWDDDLVKTVSRGSSSSVGDIFVKDGNCYIVDNFGFVAIGKYEM